MDQTQTESLSPQQKMVSISKSELSQLPVASYDNDIVVVDSETEAEKAAEVLSGEKMIGFDTETKPCFRKGHANKVALLQLSTHDTCFLIRLNHIGLPRPIAAVLENPGITKLGVSIHDDFRQLQKMYNITPEGFIDLQTYVKDFSILDNSLARIYGILFGKRISKGQRLTNWEADKLTVNQREYASLDAFACIQIYELLKTEGFSPEKSPYYKTMEEIHPSAPNPPVP